MNISPAEILTILLIALVVFGPRRLPEMARKGARLLRELKGAMDDLKREVSEEYQEAADQFDTLRREIGSTLDDDEAAGPTPDP